MKRGKKIIGLLTASMVLLMGASIQTFAAQKIKKVSITVTNDFKVGEDYSEDDVEVTTKDETYSISDIEILNEDDEWRSSDVPMIEVYLQAEDGYYFSVAKSTIKVKGGTYVSGRKDGSTTIILKLQLPSLKGQVGDVNDVRWESQTVGSWEETYNTGYYEVRLYRDGKSVGNIQKSGTNSFDFASSMTRSGTYSFRMRAVNAQDNTKRSDWQEADGTVYIDEETAAQYKSQYGTATSSGATEPGQAANQQNQQYGWILDHVGWWYRNGDGSYTTNNWQFIDGKWYFFDSVGYMVTGWIEWNGESYYCTPENGDMLADTVVPDGSGRRVDSSGAWIR